VSRQRVARQRGPFHRLGDRLPPLLATGYSTSS
jgi:hypothetical protein